jgi:hypothetical protein
MLLCNVIVKVAQIEAVDEIFHFIPVVFGFGLVTTELTCGWLSLKVLSHDAEFLFHFFLCRFIDICFCLQQVGGIKDEHSIFLD